MAKVFSVPPVAFSSLSSNSDVPQQRRASGAGPASAALPASANLETPTSPTLAPLHVLRHRNRCRLFLLFCLYLYLLQRPSSRSFASIAARSGPFLFLMAFGLFQLLAGEFHFGIILGWAKVAAFFLYMVFNMLAERNGNLHLHRCSREMLVGPKA